MAEDNRIVTHLDRTCDYPDCWQRATRKVNLPYVAAYMAQSVCADHESWAVEEIRSHLPTDR